MTSASSLSRKVCAALWCVSCCGAAGLFLLIHSAGARTEGASPSADLVLFGGTIITVDTADSLAEALAVKDGKILAVGSNSDVRRYAGKMTRLVDLRGHTVTPGLIDTHFHFTKTDEMNEVDLSKVTNIHDAMARVQERAATSKPGDWIRGGGWDESKLAELRHILASDIDTVAPNNPVWLTQTTGHYGTANRCALKLAGITKATKDPAAGTIDRDSNGEPSGILKESAMDLIWDLIPRYTHDQEKAGLLKAIADANSEGMTGVKDPGIFQDKWNLYTELLREGKLSLHVFALWYGGRTMTEAREILAQTANLPAPPRGLGDDILLSRGIKLMMDGSGGARTGWLYRDWNKNYKDLDKGNLGYPTTDPPVYKQMVKFFHDAGYTIGTHAVGDRAIDFVVDTYTEVLKGKPTVGLRDSVIHANLPTKHAIDTMAALQKRYDSGYPESQPTFMWWIGDTYAGNYGPARSLRIEPFKTYLAKGVRWTGGSDYPVTPFAARFGIWASIARRPLKGVYDRQPFGIEESVDVHTALRSYTIWAARQLFLETRTGSLEVGKDADLAVWDRNLYTVPTDSIKDMKCLLTMFRGQIVYDSKELGIAESPN